MSLLKNIKSDPKAAQEKDVLGGGGVLESGAYSAVIDTAYLSASKGGAVAVNITFKTKDNKQLRQQFWVSSGNDKGNKNTYEKDGETFYLPGYLQANAIAQLAANKELGDIETEMKIVKIYDFTQKKEVPESVEMLMDLLGKEVVLGVIKQTVDKTAKDGAGNYLPTGETRDENEVDKVFRAEDNMTTAEARMLAEDPTTTAKFFTAWCDKNTGVTRNKAKGASGTAGSPVKPGAVAGAKPKSLFGSA